MFDCHVHSTFSTDSKLQAETACEIAISRGLDGIAFTDHLDYDFPDYDDGFLIDFDIYTEFMDKLKKRYESKLKIIKGIEVGIQHHVISDTNNVLEKYNFDFIIGSVHIIDGHDPYRVVYYNGKTKAQAYSRYLEEIVNMLNNFNNFDILGHMDYIIRYADYDDRMLRYNEHTDLFDEIFRKLISMGKGFEINTGSYKDFSKGLKKAEYDISLLKRYKELGGEIISFGSDAHNEEHLAYKIDYFKELLHEAGFKHSVHYENRVPVFDPIDK